MKFMMRNLILIEILRLSHFFLSRIMKLFIQIDFCKAFAWIAAGESQNT